MVGITDLPLHSEWVMLLNLLRTNCGYYCRYFLTQNAAIKAGTATGLNLNLKTLAIGNGLTVSIALPHKVSKY